MEVQHAEQQAIMSGQQAAEQRQTLERSGGDEGCTGGRDRQVRPD